MKNFISFLIILFYCNLTHAQGLGNLLGGNKDGGNNPLGNILGGNM